MPKRLSMSDTDFGSRPSPADKLLRPNNVATTTDTDADNEVGLPIQAPNPALEPNDSQAKSRQVAKEEEYKRTSFYLSERQLDKLDDFAHALSKHRRERLNRQDVLRRLVDDFKIDLLLENWD